MDRFFLILAILSAVVVFVTVYSLFRSRKRPLLHSSVIEVPLESLAQVWLKTDSPASAVRVADREPVKEGSPVEQPAHVGSVTLGFYRDCIQPHEELLKSQDAFDLVTELIELLEKQGGCPSVVLSGQDRESMSVAVTVKDTLAKVTLREHTYQVVLALVDLVRDSYVDWQFHIPQAIVAGLAHDIGKIPEFHTGHYNTYEHPLISENKLMEMVYSLEQAQKPVPVWISTVREAVREHHNPAAKGQLSVLLKKADRESRTVELARHMSQYRISSMSEWFQVDEFIRQLEPHINIVQTTRWNAISFKGVVYVRPDFAWEIVNQMRESKKVLDSLFIYGDSNEQVLKQLADRLRKAGVLCPFVREGYYAVRCVVFTDTSRVTGKKLKQMLIPLKLDAVATVAGQQISSIESRKAGITQVLMVEPDFKQETLQ